VTLARTRVARSTTIEREIRAALKRDPTIMTMPPQLRVPGLSLAKIREPRGGSLPAPGAAAVVHLALLGALLAAAVFADGGTVPQAWLACEFAAGVLLISWVVAGGRTRAALAGTRARTAAPLTAVSRAAMPLTDLSRAERFPLAVFVLPLYAIVQAVPLPLALVKLLSPARAELQESIASWMPHVPAWTPLSVHPEATLDFALRLAAYAAVYWIVRGLAERFDRNRFAVAAPIVLVATAQSAIALLQNFGAEPATGSYINRNHLAGLLEMALPFVVVPLISLLPAAARRRLSSESRRAPAAAARMALAGTAVWAGTSRSAAIRTALATAAAVLLLAAILATRSRAGLVAALVSLLVIGLASLQRIKPPRKRWLLGAMLPALCAAAFLYLPPDNLVRRYANVFGGEALRREGRVLLWNETLDLIAAYPLAGCGFGGFEPAFVRFKRSAPMVADAHAHNDYLELLAEAGLIGFALCLLLAARPIAAAVRAIMRSHVALDSSWSSSALASAGSGQDADLALACVASLAAILVHSFVDFNLRIPANGMVFVWLLGMCCACGEAVAQIRRGGASSLLAGPSLRSTQRRAAAAFPPLET
jgi:O-antigen ligase